MVKNNKKKMFNKKIMILLICITIIIPMVVGASWTQVTPNPTTIEIARVWALSTGRAVAHNDYANRVFVYSSNLWYEITLPNLTGYPSFISSGKTNNGLAHFTWRTAESGYYKYKHCTLDTSSITWYCTNKETPTQGIMSSFGCEGNSNNCYIKYYDAGVYRLQKIYPSEQNYPTQIFPANDILIYSNEGLWARFYQTGSSGAVSEWTGFGWNRWTQVYGAGNTMVVEGATNRGIPSIYSTHARYLYNYTTNSWVRRITSPTPERGLWAVNINGEYWQGSTYSPYGIYKCSWNFSPFDDCTLDTATTSNINTMDYDTTSGVGWAVTGVSTFFKYEGTTPPTTPYELSVTINPNPTTYGQPVNWSVTPTHNESETSTIDCSISETGNPDFYTWNFYNAISGTKANNGLALNDLGWNNFQANTDYTYKCNSTSATGDKATSQTINWSVTGGTLKTNTRVSPNPSNYGGETIFYSKADNPLGTTNNITLQIWDSNYTTLIWQKTQNNVPNGIEIEMSRLTINTILWETFPLGTYYVDTQACYFNLTGIQCGVGDETQPPNYGITIWNVIQGAMTNETKYKATCYNEEPPTGITGIYTITRYDENNVFASIQDNNDNLYLASYDITNPSNIIFRAMYTTPDDPYSINTSRALNKQTGRNNNPSIISKINMIEGGNRIYVGTNNGLFIYNNSETKDARELTYEHDLGFGILENDGIADVSAQNDNHAWVCQDGTGLETDDVYRYNTTEQSWDNKMNNPYCYNLIWDNSYVYVHRGAYNDIKIWDATTQTTTATIDFFAPISTYTGYDIIDYNNQYLFFVSSKNEIRKYDTTNKTNPVYIAKCLTPETTTEIISIETINQEEVLIGTIDTTNGDNIIYVCDYNNSETYSVTRAGYIAQYLTGTYNRQWQIIKNDNKGKFSIAEENMFEVCYYEKTYESVEINNPPTIDDYTFTPSQTICLNQAVNIEIIASDQDIGDDIRYGVSCSGGGTPTSFGANNLLTCSYSTIGTKTITLQVVDNGGAYSNPTYDTIQVNDCQITNPTNIFFKIIDGNTANAIQGATIQLYDEETLIQTKITDNLGYADFTGITTYKQYRAVATKDGYAPMTQYFYPRDTRYTRALEPTETERTLLIVNVKDDEGNNLENALVSTLEPVTGSSKYGLTDFTGNAYLFDIEPSDKFIVGAKKEGYETTSTYTSIGTGEQKSISIVMGETTPPTGIFPTTQRHCADTIAGVILCGNLSISGSGSRCTEDTDCISGRCSLAISPEARKCSTFNYTLCDNQGLNRGNTCIFRNITIGMLKGIGNFILDYFLYVLIIVLLLVAGLIIRRSLTH